ncbi:MAG: DUF4349 domain-containing protein, partial [Actinomycetaceae bacterium]|nr:DUF4349 domain-containing protein [Actinomycetaceae bacterium]
MKRHPLALSALVLALTFSIVGCAPESGTNATPPADRSSPASEPLPGETHMEPAQPSAPADEAGEVASTDRPDTADAKDASTIIPTTQIVVGTASIEVKNVSESLDSLTSWVQAQSGRISSSELYGDKGTTGGRATVRIPAERYEALVDHIQSMGELTHISSKSDDVGQQIADVDGRIKALETSVARLTDLMKNATNTADLVAAEKELTA